MKYHSLVPPGFIFNSVTFISWLNNKAFYCAIRECVVLSHYEWQSLCSICDMTYISLNPVELSMDGLSSLFSMETHSKTPFTPV